MLSTEFERGTEVLMVQQPILGCSLNNLAQEINPLAAGFRARTTQVFQTWREACRSALTPAQQRQIVLGTVDPGDVAHLLVAQIEGTLSLHATPKTPDPGDRGLRIAQLPGVTPRSGPVSRPETGTVRSRD